MRPFIVPTDFSPEAENALQYACAAAKQFGAKVILFNSFSYSIHASNSRLSASGMQELEEHNTNILKNKTETLSTTYDIDIEYEYGLMLGVVEELDVLMTKYQAELVIMGMAPRSLAQELFGNTTTAVIMKQKYPVLAVPLGATFSGLNKILFACEDINKIQKEIINRIRSIAVLPGSEVEVFHVRNKEVTGSDPSSPVIREGLDGIVHYYKSVTSRTIIKEIEKEIKRFDADLLVMMPKKYGFWESMIHRSKTRIMASNNSVPLLSLPFPQESR